MEPIEQKRARRKRLSDAMSIDGVSTDIVLLSNVIVIIEGVSGQTQTLPMII